MQYNIRTESVGLWLGESVGFVVGLEEGLFVGVCFKEKGEEVHC